MNCMWMWASLLGIHGSHHLAAFAILALANQAHSLCGPELAGSGCFGSWPLGGNGHGNRAISVQLPCGTRCLLGGPSGVVGTGGSELHLLPPTPPHHAGTSAKLTASLTNAGPHAL